MKAKKNNMIRIKALNDQSEYSNNSEDSNFQQVTQEAEEEELNGLYINALKHATDGDRNLACKLLEQLKRELEIDVPKIKDAFLLRRLKYLTYKNLGLFRNDLNLIFDALEIDDSDINLWITAGRKSKEKFNYLLAKHCFEKAYNFNTTNYTVIENLIDLYFITNNLHRCVSVCIHALKLDREYLRGKVILNECIRSMPPILKELNPEYLCHIYAHFGGQDDHTDYQQIEEFYQTIISPLAELKAEQFRCESPQFENQIKKRKPLILNLDPKKCSTFEKIGFKIKNIYDLILRKHYNLFSKISVEFNENTNSSSIINNNFNNSDENSNLNISMTTEITTDNKDEDNEEKTNGKKLETKEQQKANEKQMLYEYTDKRRSSRVKTKSKNCDCEDDLSISDALIKLLPDKFKNETSKQSIENHATDTCVSAASNSVTSINGDSQSDNSKLFETELVDRFMEKLKSWIHSKKRFHIFELIEFYLMEISSLKKLSTPKVFLTLYKIYRDENPLPCGTLCEIGKDITTDMVFVCLSANEIEYSKQETLFLKQIIFKLCFNLSLEEYRQFLIRFFVLCGSKELNIDFLHYALDFCRPNSKFLKNFTIPSEENCDENSMSNSNEQNSYEVLATNQLKINAQYINTLIDMQNVSLSELSSDQNYSDIIRCFTKSETDLTVEEKQKIFDAITKAEIWQKGVDLLENWSHLSEDCLRCILQCVENGNRAHISSKLAKKIVKRAANGNSITAWLILYWCLTYEEVDRTEMIKFFTIGHNVLGKRGLCTDHDGDFLLFAQKVFVESDLEDEALMCFSCLFNFPPRKNQQDCHTSAHIELKWSHCQAIYEYFVPELMPEFDSRLSGINQEVKDMFIKFINLMPDFEKPRHAITVTNYIKRGESLTPIVEDSGPNNPIVTSIYYLLADYHFKAKDFDKAKYFYIYDLSLNVDRFDSWAGLALSINYKLDQMLIESTKINTDKFNQTAYSTMRCFEKALQIQPDNSKIWIEYGILCYNVASNWSRLLKGVQFASLTTSYGKENQFFHYEQILSKAKYCFERCVNDVEDNEESWLSFYMLGKVAEKSKEDLLTVLQYYEWAYLNLYLDGAVYPKKILYYNPQYLSIEALEVYYRIHSCVLKYLLNNRKFTARMLRQLKFHLIKVNKSPFVLRKQFTGKRTGSSSSSKKQNGSNCSKNQMDFSIPVISEDDQILELVNDVVSLVSERDVKFDVNRARNELLAMCIHAIKKCLSRYNGHYKSYYRLAHYYNAIGDYQIAKAILCSGSNQNKNDPLLRFEQDPYKPNSNPGSINGLFFERKPNNLYQGIWRIPVDEIERAGNFNFHMFRCTNLLITVCTKTEDFYMLHLIAQQLNKQPEPDKKYVNDTERMMLSRKAFEKCFQILENKIFNQNQRLYVEECQQIAQNLIKNNVFTKEILAICTSINEKLMAAHNMAPNQSRM